MVSESRCGNLNGCSLQSLQFPTMTVTQDVANKSLMIKIAPKKVGAERGMESCEFDQRKVILDECSHSISGIGNKSHVMNKSHKFVLHSSDDPKLYAVVSDLRVKLPMPGSKKRREPPGILEVQDEKRRKMNRSVKQQCAKVLKTLMTDPSGWVFNIPVDPVAYKIPDYFSIISHPMDLGTVRNKLENYEYFDVEEFAADVRLTFSNAMLYNPPSNDVHQMAKRLNNIFSSSWKSLEKWGHERKNVKQGFTYRCGEFNTGDATKSCHKKSPARVSLLSKSSMSSDEKKQLSKELMEASRGKMTETFFRSFLKKIGLICSKQENIEKDIGALDDETLRELKRVIKGSDAKAAKMKPAKMAQNGGCSLVGKVFRKGTDNSRSACGSAKTKQPLSLATFKCGSCGGVTCQCSLRNDSAHALSSDLSSERSFGQDHGVSRRDMLTSEMSKSDPDSDGAVSTLDEEHFLSSLQLSASATTAASEECATHIDVQLSPKKALRAAMLKSRFADIILKAKLDHGEVDPVKMQQEKERLERQQREVNAKIEAQIRAAESESRLRAEAESKSQREREREAARIALQEMEKTVDINNNVEILKDLEMLSGWSQAGHSFDVERGSEGLFGKPLERLGLFLKEDFMGDEYDDEPAVLQVDGEEG